MTQTKTARITALDKQLREIEKQADNIGFNIDALPEWAEVTALVVAYEWNERHYTAHLKRQIDDLLLAIGWAVFLHWAELKHSGMI